ncbi:MAG TPA: dihydrodipicolinate synthase family protein, partial [Thermoplasmata archaeon]|nr:dihydrodipicolinate synthase family protein [Thermoplasmata archaeon]
MALEGLAVPMVTLFDADGGLDLARNARFVQGLSDARVDHLFVLGSTGEFPSVLSSERAPLIDVVVENATGLTDVWVGCGAPSTSQAVAFAKEAEAAGAAALVAVP